MSEVGHESLREIGKELVGIESSDEVKLYRYRYPDGSLSGVLFPFAGGVMTARHVVDLHNLHGFTSGSADHLDIAYKYDSSIRGLPLGFVNEPIIRGTKIVTSLSSENDQLVSITGDIGPLDMPTILRVFIPVTDIDAQNIIKYIQPGASGSPIVFQDHIIGIVPFQSLNNPHEVPVVAFSGYLMKDLLDEMRLEYDKLN